MTLSPLEKLKAAAAARTQAAPAAPQAEAPTKATAVIPAASPAPQAAPAAQQGAKNALAALFNKSPDELDTANLFAEVNGGGGGIHGAYAQIKNKNWHVPKKLSSDIEEYMPSGNRGFTMIPLGKRLAYTQWPFSKAANGKPDGQPPLSRGAIPSPRVYAGSIELQRRVIGVGSKVQYKKYTPETLKAAGLGKLTPETHVFGWTPNVGFLTLVVPGFKSSELTMEQLSQDTVNACIGVAPLVFIIDLHSAVNKKAAPGADNATWEDAFLRVEAQPTHPKTSEYIAKWEEFSNGNIEKVAEAVQAFLATSDYGGESVEATEKLVARFEMCRIGS